MATRAPAAKDNYTPLDYALAALIFALMGAFFWAIRGTGGYGGTDGGALAGLGWAMLWYTFSRHGEGGRLRPYGTGFAIAAITFGIAFGGQNGYGLYNSWVDGRFRWDSTGPDIPIAPWTGFAMLAINGLNWGGTAGAMLAWCAPARPAGWGSWALRIGGGVFGAWLLQAIVYAYPQYFLPFFEDKASYIAQPNGDRAYGTVGSIAMLFGLTLGFLAAEIVRRDWRAVALILLMAIGFALPFSIGGHWHTLDGPGPWWKCWEMTIGAGGGLAFGLAFFLFNRPTLAAPRPVTQGERAWAAVLIVLASTLVVTNCYEGFGKVHGYLPEDAEMTTGRLAVTLLWLLGVSGGFIWWFRANSPIAPRDALHDDTLLPMGVMPAILAVIVVAGFLVSLTGRGEGYLLPSLYSVYILVSLAAFGVLEYRRRNA